MKQYEFSNTWFQNSAKGVWDQLIPNLNPRRILEIGAFEGAATCYLIEKLALTRGLEIHCIDSWEGGIEHNPGNLVESYMSQVEGRFKHNTELALSAVQNKVELIIHKGLSDAELPKLLISGKKSHFDFIYVDGSHQAPDVLFDAVVGFKLLKVGGVMAFDDYIWAENLPGGVDPIRCPKPAVDAFTNIYCRKIKIIPAPLAQLYIQKVSE
jgi:predicted O-methyltransferase YrrM